MLFCSIFQLVTWRCRAKDTGCATPEADFDNLGRVPTATSTLFLDVHVHLRHAVLKYRPVTGPDTAVGPRPSLKAYFLLCDDNGMQSVDSFTQTMAHTLNTSRACVQRAISSHSGCPSSDNSRFLKILVEENFIVQLRCLFLSARTVPPSNFVSWLLSRLWPDTGMCLATGDRCN